MLKEFLEVGKIVTTHGIRGEVKVEPWCDTPDFLKEFSTLYLDKGKTPMTVVRARSYKNMGYLQLQGVDTMDQAQTLRGKVLYIRRSDAHLQEGEFFIQDLIGLTVVDADSEKTYGTLCQVSETGANDVYHIKGEDGKVRLIPAIPQVVVETDLEKGIMTIRPLEGLFDED